jgi:hypothetical protein
MSQMEFDPLSLKANAWPTELKVLITLRREVYSLHIVYTVEFVQSDTWVFWLPVTSYKK